MAFVASRFLVNLALLSLLLANAGAVRTAMQAVAAPASPAVSEGNLIAALEALLSASKVEEPGHPRFARADALLTLLKVHSSVKKADAVTPLEPFFAGLKNVLTSDPLGSTMATLFAKVPAMPDPLLAGARDIEGGRYGEGHTDRAGGLDAGLSVARFGPCIMQGAGEVAGAYAQGTAPKVIDISPRIIEVHPKGLDASPAEINISPTLIQVAPGFTAARPGTVQDALISAAGGLADSLSGAAGGSDAAGAAGGGPGIALPGN